MWWIVSRIFGSLGQLISHPKEEEYGKEDLHLEIKRYGDPDISKSFLTVFWYYNVLK